MGEDDLNEEELEGIVIPSEARENAILFRGEPIANLPTQRIFAYAAHGVKAPLGLEWVNDTNVVLVWESTVEAKSAFVAMREAGTLHQVEDEEGFLPARPLPETLWPMEMRLEKALGKSVAQSGQIWMRWARATDVKVKGGKVQSKFYEKYGEDAGKEGQNDRYGPRQSHKRKRLDEDNEMRMRLDAGQCLCNSFTIQLF